MRVGQQETEPPIYRWDRIDALVFIGALLLFELFLLGCLLAIPGFGGLLLTTSGVYSAIYCWPRAFSRFREWRRFRDEVRVFREEIEEHEKH